MTDAFKLRTDSFVMPTRKAKRPRDMQRQYVYKCDWALMKQTRHFWFDDMQEWVKHILVTSWEEGLFGNSAWGIATYAPITVRPGYANGRRAYGGKEYISMPSWSRHELIVCHELAHTFTIRLYGNTVAAHGSEYCAIYLKLTKRFISVDMADRLELEFIKHGVSYDH